MKIVMAAIPRQPETAEKHHWTVTVIRAFGIVQIIACIVSSYLFLRLPIQSGLMSAFNMSYDGSLLITAIVTVLVGLFAGMLSSALLFAFAMALDDLHTIRGYLRDIHMTGQYYDE